MGDAQILSDTMRGELQRFADGTLKGLLEGMVKQLRHDLIQDEPTLHSKRTTKETKALLKNCLAKSFRGATPTSGQEPLQPRLSPISGMTFPTPPIAKDSNMLKESINSQSSTTVTKKHELSLPLSEGRLAEPTFHVGQNHASAPLGIVGTTQRRGKKSPPTLQPHSLLEDDEESAWLLDTESPRDFHMMSGSRGRAAVTSGFYSRLSERALAIVTHAHFDLLIGMGVFLNAAALGWETDSHLKNPDASAVAPIVRTIEASFCAFFTSELTLRIAAFGRSFCNMEGWQWNAFDSLLVLLQIADMFEESIESLHLPIDMKILRMLRIPRLLRITRLVRVLHLFDELRSMITSMGSSISSLCWALVLLAVMVYIFAVFMLQMILQSGTSPANNEELAKYFGSLQITCFTLVESVAGGINWDEAVQPLMAEVYPLMGFVYSIYIGISLLVMMNMVTAVFVERVTKTVREDKDVIMASKIADAFFDSENPDGEISRQDFEQVLQSGIMQDYFKDLEMNLAEGRNLARALFDILDIDSSGGVSSFEMVSGVLRLRGPAKALDLALLTHDIAQLQILLLELQDNFDVRWREIATLVTESTSE